MICEVCSKPYNPAEMRRIEEEYGSDIYRPGEDVESLEELTTEEQAERQAEIEAIFANPDGYRVSDKGVSE